MNHHVNQASTALNSPTTSATYCLAAAEESFGSINKQVSLNFKRKKKKGK